MRYGILLLLAGLILALVSVKSAEAQTITFDWGTEPEASNFDDVSSASTTVDGVTMSAAMIVGSQQFNISSAFGGSQSLGARGVGSQDNFDGEAGFTFSFDSPGTLTSIIMILDEFGAAYSLTTPNDGVHPYTADFSGESFEFEAGETFTWNHVGGSYRVGQIVIEVPEPSTATLGLLLVGIAATWRRMRGRERATA